MRKARMLGMLLGLLLLTGVALPPSASAQDPPDPQEFETGLGAFKAYHGGDIDSVSLTLGNLTLHTPFWSYPQRGGKLKLDFFIQFDSNLYWIKERCPHTGDPCYWLWRSKGGILAVDEYQRLSAAQGTCCLRGTAVMGDRSVHMMGQVGTVWNSLDATAIRYDPVTMTTMDRAGIRYTALGTAPFTQTREDPNGNRATVEPNYGGNDGYYRDTLGRQILFPPYTNIVPGGVLTDASGCTGPRPIAEARLWNIPGPNGGTTSIKFCVASILMRSNFASAWEVGSQWSNLRSMIQSIVLTDGTTWSFEYDDRDPGDSSNPNDPNYVNYGQLTKVTFPTGGTLSYTWMTVNGNTEQPLRIVATRTLDANDGTGPHTWTYAWGIPAMDPTWGNYLQASFTNVMTDPDGNDTVYTVQGLRDSSGTNTGALYVTQSQYYQGSRSTGTLLKTVNTDYSYLTDPYPPNTLGPSRLDNIVPIRVTTTWPGGKISKVETDYDAGFTFSALNLPGTYGNVIAKREYDYGAGAPGPLLRTTNTAYLALGNPSYKANNLVDLVSSVTVLDGAGVQLAQTTYGYDGYALSTSGVTTQLNLTPAAGSYRGNLTSTSRWRNTDSASLTSTTTFYDTGMAYQTKDPLLHTTTFSYSPTFAGAYVTQVTNALGHVASSNYDFNTGLLTSTADPNNQTTTYAYDNLNRITQRNLPDGGQTTFAYTAAAPFKVTITHKITNTPLLNFVAEAQVDGLGRKKITRVMSDPQGTTYTRIDYDARGRVWKLWNPTRCNLDIYPPPTSCAGEPTFGVAENQYDALSRIAKVIPQDGTATTNNMTTVYADNCTTVTDQTGKTRKSCADALGRLTRVFEPDSNGNLIYETDYMYEVLDNLTCVEQHGNVTGTGCSSPPSSDATSPWRVRRFTYDSLPQLLQASNPESGTISYIYDNDGNLLTKTAPAPNQTGSATVTATMTYDALDRVTQKSYSDGTTSTVKYGYDAIAPSGCTPPALTINNGIGRRTSMCDAAGAEAWSYDAMGRALTDRRTTNSITKDTIYGYNLDGSIATLTYPGGRIITYQPGGAGRPLWAKDLANSINYVTGTCGPTSDGVCYAPQGAPASLQNGASLVSTFYYNNRLQPCRISVKSSGTAPTQCTDSTNIGSVLDFTYNFSLGTADNGNVSSITNNRDTTRSQSFSYDALYRVATAQTTATTGSKCWGETFSYDIWGNLLTIGGVSGYTGCSQENLSVTATIKNQISGYTYDAPGNLTATPAPAAASYTYNAENQLTATAGVTYTYDGDGWRVQKSNGKLYWYGTSSDPITETDLAANNPVEYVLFEGKRVARRDAAGSISYYFADHLGTARVVSSATGQVLDDSDFYPFGGERPAIPPTSANNYKFTSKERDSESGNDHFPARDYASTMGRWLRPDPLPWIDWQHGKKDDQKKFENFLLNPQNFNMYGYVVNNPLNMTDPTGMKGCQAGDKKFETCTITITYDPKTSKGTLTVTGQNKGDKNPTVLLTGSVVVGGNGHVTPTGTFTAKSWEKDHVSIKYGSWANTKWSDSWFGRNVFGPYQLHIRELDKQGIFIHGTLGPSWNPTTWGNIVVGSVSHGCVRLCNADDIALHNLMPNPEGNQIIIKTTP